MKMIVHAMEILEKWEIRACTGLLVAMSLVVLLQVFSRYLFNHAFVWAEELVRYLMIWMVMIGAALVQATNEHIRIDFLPMLAGPRARIVMDSAFRVCILLFLLILIVKGVRVARFNRLFESSGLGISMFWPTVALPVGAFLMALYTIRALAADLHRLISGKPRR